MTKARPILVVEDDHIQRENLVDSLGNEFAVSAAANFAEADQLFAVENARFDAVILDLGMPDGDGLAYCARLRRQGHAMPIIIVAGSCDDATVVHGLDAGANDYLIKPFRMNELLARLRAQLRTFDSSEDATFTIGHYSFKPASKLLIGQNNRRLRLTSKETEILKFLYRAGKVPVKRAVLLDGVWGYNSGVTTHTLETHIYRLRQKIELDPRNCRIVVTENGGYRLHAVAAQPPGEDQTLPRSGDTGAAGCTDIASERAPGTPPSVADRQAGGPLASQQAACAASGAHHATSGAHHATSGAHQMNQLPMGALSATGRDSR